MNRDSPLTLISRRSFMSAGWLGMLAIVERSHACQTVQGEPFLKTRGVVITPNDVTLGDWQERAKQAGLTTIALHPFPSTVLKFVQSDDGKQFLEKCDRLGLQVEYELHAMRELLPGNLFLKDNPINRMPYLPWMPTSRCSLPTRLRFWNTGSMCPGSRVGSDPP